CEDRGLWLGNAWRRGLRGHCPFVSPPRLKGGGDKACQHLPADAAWHHLAQSCPRTVAEWRGGGLTKGQPRRTTDAQLTSGGIRCCGPLAGVRWAWRLKTVVLQGVYLGKMG